MRRNQSSLTAAGIAITRGLESEKPEDERICYDPFARRFSPAWLYSLMRFFIRIGYAEWRGPGVIGYLMARERYFDDTLAEYLKGGLEQLVILGAGFDSRAYRFDLQQKGVLTFEVDHPATQEAKLLKVRDVFHTIPEHVKYVPVDFNTQTLEERLPAHGYNTGRKSLFLWQGVSMYLTPEAVDATLAFVRDFSAGGSAIVFDYLYKGVLVVQKQAEIQGMRRHRFMTGESLTFGIEKGTVEAFLEERGFKSVRDVDAEYLKKAYCIGKNAGRSITSGYGIVVAAI